MFFDAQQVNILQIREISNSFNSKKRNKEIKNDFLVFKPSAQSAFRLSQRKKEGGQILEINGKEDPSLFYTMVLTFFSHTGAKGRNCLICVHPPSFFKCMQFICRPCVCRKVN